MAKLVQWLLLALVALCIVAPFVSASSELVANENEQVEEQMEQWLEASEGQEDDSAALMEISADAEAEAESESELMAEAEAEVDVDRKRHKLNKFVKKLAAKAKRAGKKARRGLKKALAKIKKALKKGGVTAKKGLKKVQHKLKKLAKKIARKVAKRAAKKAKKAAKKARKLPVRKPLLSAEQVNQRWETESAKKIATLNAPKIEYYHEIQNIDGKVADRTARAVIDTPQRAAYRKRVKDDIRYAKTVSSAASLVKTTNAFLPKKAAKKL